MVLLQSVQHGHELLGRNMLDQLVCVEKSLSWDDAVEGCSPPCVRSVGVDGECWTWWPDGLVAILI